MYPESDAMIHAKGLLNLRSTPSAKVGYHIWQKISHRPKDLCVISATRPHRGEGGASAGEGIIGTAPTDDD